MSDEAKGELNLSMDAYLQLPAASASLVKRIINECPRAAWADSWLNPCRVIENSKQTDRGTIAHALLLEGDNSALVAIDPNDHPAENTGAIPNGWTNKSIRAARDTARACGKIPVLLDDAMAIRGMVGNARAFIESLKDTEPAIWAAFQPGGGVSEETLTWQDGKTLCKMRPDRRNNDWTLMVDYKTTARSAEPGSWGRTQLVGMDYYLSAAWYRRGAAARFGVAPDYLFLVQEVEAPYLCSLVGAEPAILEVGNQQIVQALATWQQCVREQTWAGYPPQIIYPVTPAWMMAESEELQIQYIEENGMPNDKEIT